MGNQASAALAVANAKSKMNSTMDEINKGLKTQPKSDGPKNRREHELRRKEREMEFREKQVARAERKSKLSEKWAAHHQENTEAPAKKGLFSK